MFVGNPGRKVTVFVGHCIGACGNSTVWLLWLMCSVSYSWF